MRQFFLLQNKLTRKNSFHRKVIDDFKQLNKSTSATKIQIGKSYKFPYIDKLSLNPCQLHKGADTIVKVKPSTSVSIALYHVYYH